MSEDLEAAGSTSPVIAAEVENEIARGGGELLTLLVEVELPEPRVKLRVDRRGGRRRMAPMGFHAESSTESEDRRRVVDETRAHLEAVVGEPPKWLASAHTFIVRAEPSRVLELAACDHVRAVRLSRELAPG